MKDSDNYGIRDPGDGYQIYERQVVYDGRLIKVVRDHIRLPNGIETRHEHLRYPAAVAVMGVCDAGDGQRQLLMLEQFRSSIGGYIYEIPAGMVEEGEEPLSCARRELEEETGYCAERWTPVVTILPTPGISPVRMFYFLAEGVSPTGQQKLDEGECLVVRSFPLDGLVDSLVFGKNVPGIPPMVDAKVHMAVFFLGAYLYHPR